MAYEKVKNPKHYEGEGGLTALDVIYAYGFGEGMALGSAIKYILRAGKKPNEDAIDDLSKAVEYLQSHIKFLHDVRKSESAQKTIKERL